MNYRVVFTGGPGSGKTTVINLLSYLGYQTAPEVGRKVIQFQVNSQGTALPWMDKAAFRDEMVFEEISNYKNYGNSVLTFFDRSIIDSYGYSKLEKIQISDILLKKCQELAYNRNVFVFPPWESIYKNDTDRKQSFNEAVATYNEMVKAYKQFGYRLIEVPKVSVTERVDFVLHVIGNG